MKFSKTILIFYFAITGYCKDIWRQPALSPAQHVDRGGEVERRVDAEEVRQVGGNSTANGTVILAVAQVKIPVLVRPANLSRDELYGYGFNLAFGDMATLRLDHTIDAQNKTLMNLTCDYGAVVPVTTMVGDGFKAGDILRMMIWNMNIVDQNKTAIMWNYNSIFPVIDDVPFWNATFEFNPVINTIKWSVSKLPRTTRPGFRELLVDAYATARDNTSISTIYPTGVIDGSPFSGVNSTATIERRSQIRFRMKEAATESACR